MSPQRLSWDWYDGEIPDNVDIHPQSYVETSYSFLKMRSGHSSAVRIGAGAGVYKSTMFDLGPAARVDIGYCALVHGARVICDDAVSIGDYALISWNVIIMDTYRLPLAVAERRIALERGFGTVGEYSTRESGARPVVIGANTWLGFDVVVLPGVTIGEGSIVGARSVVTDDVPPYCAFAGNPARLVRHLARSGA